MIDDGFDGLDDIPDDLPDAERRQLLGDLDALKGLLDERRPVGEDFTLRPPQPDAAAIPILLEALGAGTSASVPAAATAAQAPRPPATPADVAVARAAIQPSLFGDSLPEPATRSRPAPPTPRARTAQDNPYLPQSIKDRLAQSQAKATRELRSLLDGERTGPIDRRSGSNWQQAQQRVKSRAAVIIQQVIDEHLPRIEEDLRRRLKQELDQALRELGIDRDQPPPV